MKPISYKEEMGDTERMCIWEGPTGSSSVSLTNSYVLYFTVSSAYMTALHCFLEFLFVFLKRSYEICLVYDKMLPFTYYSFYSWFS